MRILIATPLYPPAAGGPATYSKLVETELERRGHKVKIINFGSVLRLPKGARHLAYFLKVFLSGLGCDLVFSLDPVSVGYPSRWACRILRKPLLVKVVGDYAWEQGRQRFEVKDLLDEFIGKEYSAPVERLRKLQLEVVQSADRIIVPSKYLKNIVSAWGVPAEKIKVIYNSVNIPSDLVDKDIARDMFGVGEDEFLVLSVGRNVPWKGFEDLRVVVGELEKSNPNMRLEIFHDIPHREVLLWMRAADIFVLNSGYEGFPHLIIESMGAGTPVVSSSAGGNPEIVEDGENGILVEYGNKEEIKEAVLSLQKEDSLRGLLSKNARKTFERFNTKIMIDQLEEELKNLMQK